MRLQLRVIMFVTYLHLGAEIVWVMSCSAFFYYKLASARYCAFLFDVSFSSGVIPDRVERVFTVMGVSHSNSWACMSTFDAITKQSILNQVIMSMQSPAGIN